MKIQKFCSRVCAGKYGNIIGREKRQGKLLTEKYGYEYENNKIKIHLVGENEI